MNSRQKILSKYSEVGCGILELLDIAAYGSYDRLEENLVKCKYTQNNLNRALARSVQHNNRDNYNLLRYSGARITTEAIYKSHYLMVMELLRESKIIPEGLLLVRQAKTSNTSEVLRQLLNTYDFTDEAISDALLVASLNGKQSNCNVLLRYCNNCDYLEIIRSTEEKIEQSPNSVANNRYRLMCIEEIEAWIDLSDYMKSIARANR